MKEVNLGNYLKEREEMSAKFILGNWHRVHDI
jgi:hypothetical protein